MRRALAAISVIALAAFGLAGCGSNDAKEPGTETAVSVPAEEEDGVEEDVVTEEPAGDQTVSDACLALAGPMAEANTAVGAAAEQTASDPQSAVDAWTALADGFGDYAASVTNEEVKPVAEKLASDASAVRDEIARVFVKQDLSGMDQYTARVQEFSDSYDSLINVCGPDAP